MSYSLRNKEAKNGEKTEGQEHCYSLSLESYKLISFHNVHTKAKVYGPIVLFWGTSKLQNLKRSTLKI